MNAMFGISPEGALYTNDGCSPSFMNQANDMCGIKITPFQGLFLQALLHRATPYAGILSPFRAAPYTAVAMNPIPLSSPLPPAESSPRVSAQ